MKKQTRREFLKTTAIGAAAISASAAIPGNGASQEKTSAGRRSPKKEDAHDLYRASLNEDGKRFAK